MLSVRESANTMWNTEYSDLSIRFEKTVLVWIPCLFLWIFLPLEIYYLRHSKAFDIPFNLYNVAKLIIIALMTALTFTHTIYYYFYENIATPIFIYSSLIKFVTLGLFFGLTVANIKLGIRSSGILFLFSFLLVVFSAPQFHTELIRKNEEENQNNTSFILYTIYYSLTIIVFILNCFLDSRPRIVTHPIVKNVIPESECSFLSKLLYTWFDELTWRGYKKSLEINDLWNLEYNNTSAAIVPKFEKIWIAILKKTNKELPNVHIQINDGNEQEEIHIENQITKSKKIASVLTPLRIVAFGRAFLFGICLKLLQDALVFANPLILSLLINFAYEDEPVWRGYLYASLLFTFTIITTLLLSHYFRLTDLISLRINIGLTSLIYKKALRISNGARRNFTIGEIINLLSIDVQKLMEFVGVMHLFWSVPFQIILTTFFLWQMLGPSSLAGLAVMIIFMPVNNYVASKIKNLQIKQMRNKDKRIKLVSEILSGIKVIKFYAWETDFEKEILHIRDNEIKFLWKTAYFKVCTCFIWACVPYLESLVTFAVYVLSSDKNVLDAKTAFVSISLLYILKIPFSTFPLFITFFMQSIVALRRINKFLNSEELNANAVSHEDIQEPLIIENGKFSWEGYDGPPILNDINVKINRGKLVAVVGPVSSGKSSLISAFFGEMYKQSGFVNTNGSIAYVPQQAWIQNATIKDNITFNKTISESIYNKALDACALNVDLEILPAGDQTEIGEKGINLSGGQKQRVSLARAICFDADIYFLDDPLSAVDSHVGKHIFDYVIGPKGLLQKKTRILITHSITYLSQVDYIIVLKDGSISESGTFKELLEKKGNFAEFLLTYLKENTNESDEEELNKLQEILKEQKVVEKVIRRRSKSSESEPAQSFEKHRRTSYIKNIQNEKNISGDIDNDKLIESEKMESGNIKWKVFIYYFSSANFLLSGITIILYIAFQGFCIAANVWVSEWSSDSSIVINGTTDKDKTEFYLTIYAVIGLGQVLCILVSSLTLFLGTIKASSVIHNLLLRKIFHWPLLKFDVTPVGRIVNRFSFDLDVLDRTLVMNIQLILQYGSSILSVLFVVSYITPTFMVVIIPIGVVFYFIQRFYSSTSRQLSRLESVSRSPIYSFFNETIAGTESIRAYGLEQQFIKVFENKVDCNQKCYKLNVTSKRWLLIRLGIVANIVIFCAALFTVLERDILTPGLIGLSLSYTIQVTQFFFWLFVMISEIESNIIAVERINQYKKTSEEAPWVIQNESVPTDWPNNGEISFVDFKIRYRENLDLVLKGISFFVNGGEKVGIVGRTGAGKSSLTLGLFRIMEAAGGRIILDGIDISSIGLHTLRSRITIIPQDPVLFSGSLRFNLDPIRQYSDEQIWYALELANMKNYISNLNSGLKYEVKEGGQNFSVGQRQLICLARALLRKSKVLVLDEATAAIDLETDDIIQSTIRNQFKSSTVLTIAHRLNTIMDYDRILVIDNGLIVEYDSPEILLNRKNSVFFGMASNSGLV